jgi:hypothetical protein
MLAIQNVPSKAVAFRHTWMVEIGCRVIGHTNRLVKADLSGLGGIPANPKNARASISIMTKDAK